MVRIQLNCGQWGGSGLRRRDRVAHQSGTVEMLGRVWAGGSRLVASMTKRIWPTDHRRLDSTPSLRSQQRHDSLHPSTCAHKPSLYQPMVLPNLPPKSCLSKHAGPHNLSPAHLTFIMNTPKQLYALSDSHLAHSVIRLCAFPPKEKKMSTSLITSSRVDLPITVPRFPFP